MLLTIVKYRQVVHLCARPVWLSVSHHAAKVEHANVDRGCIGCSIGVGTRATEDWRGRVPFCLLADASGAEGPGGGISPSAERVNIVTARSAGCVDDNLGSLLLSHCCQQYDQQS